ncbi:tail fiber protein [Sphingomonas sp. HF-S3]|uniref:Tail fiber protein n=1 Tax=Sphingomonas rustica TaxID=3103142 RepID=A0ABV0B9P7_9SPHN
MSQQYVGEIRLFPYSFAPKTWAYCSGQILTIQQNQVLFALLGTTYGGNGTTTFALPDMRGRTVVGMGTGPLGSYAWGQQAGSETVTLIPSQMPSHTHLWQVTRDAGDTTAPTGNYFAASRAGGQPAAAYGAQTTPVMLAPTTIGIGGGSLPHENMQPYTALAYCIALQGLFPSRN